MKLSILAKYLEQLDQLPLTSTMHALSGEIANLKTHMAEHGVVRFENLIMQLDHDVHTIQTSIDSIAKTVQALKNSIRSAIQYQEPYYLARCMAKFTRERSSRFQSQSADHSLVLDPDTQAWLTTRIRTLQNWIYPGMIMSGGGASWIDDFRCDPIYVIDHTHERIKQAIQHLPDLAQQRMCKLVISESVGQQILTDLPDGQIGLSLIYYHFNFCPVPVINQWLQELWYKTRPGGCVCFTYNDCDLGHGIGLYESGFMSYTPGATIRKWAQNLGFAITKDLRIAADSSWMELVKPGTLASQRACQTLARVVYRPK